MTKGCKSKNFPITNGFKKTLTDHWTIINITITHTARIGFSAKATNTAIIVAIIGPTTGIISRTPAIIPNNTEKLSLIREKPNVINIATAINKKICPIK